MTQRIQPHCDEGRKHQVRSYFGSLTASNIPDIGSWRPALALAQTGTGGIQDSKIASESFLGILDTGARSGTNRHNRYKLYLTRIPDSKKVSCSNLGPWNLGSPQVVPVCTGAKACTQDPWGGAHPATNGRSREGGGGADYMYIHMYMYIYIYMRVYIYIHVYICVYIYVYIYIYIHMYMYVYIYIYVHVYIYIHTYIHTYIYIYMCVCVFVCMFILIFILILYSYTCIYIYTEIYIYEKKKYIYI